MTRAGYRRGAALLVASAAIVLTAACGAASDDPETTGGDGQNSAFAAYADCLKQNGVTITVPSGGPRTRPSDGTGREGGMPWPSGNPGSRSWPSGGPGSRSWPSGGPGGEGGVPRPSGSAGFRDGGGFPGAFGGKPEGVDDATWQKAQEACSSLRPSGRPGTRDGNRGDGRNAAYLNCLKENGVPDPAKLDPSDATLKKATETCKVLRPSAGPSPSPTA
ncbi:hypothetical protein [Actinoplanes solisilvae]|uniref:hypothetical protein n=1 Tax=Actinoplanes solisilvae TaxID=2486853 RepID=UPI001F0BECD6|nr:hypothetical protein [Actinoplanes solisilvae]